MKTVIADCETDGLLPELTRLWCLGVYDCSSGEYTCYNDQGLGDPTLEDGLAALRDADRIVMHNGLGFDVPAINKVYGPDTVDWRKVYDTLVVGRLVEPGPPQNLESIGVRYDFPKGDFSDFTRWSREMEEYMRQDVRITYLRYQEVEPKVRDWGESVTLEHAVAWIVGLQMRNGFGFDRAAAERLLVELTSEREALGADLKAAFPPILVKADKDPFVPKKDNPRMGYVAGAALTKIKVQEFNPASRQQVANRLIRAYGWRPTTYTPTGIPEVSETTLRELTQYPEAVLLADYLRLDKQIGMLDADVKPNGDGGGWLKHERDGRIYGYVNTNGAITGRMTHSKPNVSQADKKDLRMRALWVPRKAGRHTLLDGVVWDLDEGLKLVGCDAEGIELRMLGHYLYPWDGGAFIKALMEGRKEDGTDPHSSNQRLLKLFKRDNAKRVIYALIYGASDTKLGLIIIEDATEQGKYSSEAAPHLFETTKGGKTKPRSKTAIGREARAALETGIKGLKQLRETLVNTKRKRGFLIGLDGRRLDVRSEHSILNTLLQSGGAVVMKKALVLFHEKWGDRHWVDFAYCANVHDEVQMEARASLAERIGADFAAAIAEAGRALNVRCPLSGSYDIGNNWAETH